MPAASLPLLAALTPRRAHRHPDRRERRGHRLRAPGPGRHRRRHRHERAAVPHEGDPDRAETSGACSRWSAARGSPCRRTISATWPTSSSSAKRRRPGRDSSTIGKRDDTSTATSRRQDRHDPHADAAVRPAQDAALLASAACSSRAAARSSASSATSSSLSAAGRGSRPRCRSSPSWRRCARRACTRSSSSMTT